MSVRLKEWSLTWPLEFRKIKKAKGESLRTEGIFIDPQKNEAKAYPPFFGQDPVCVFAESRTGSFFYGGEGASILSILS